MYRSFSLLRKVRLVFAPGSGKSLGLGNHPTGSEPDFLRPVREFAEPATHLFLVSAEASIIAPPQSPLSLLFFARPGT